MEAQQTIIGKLTATRRPSAGKGTSRKLRAQGLIPAILYGHKQESVRLAVDPVQLRKALDPGRRRNTVIDLTIEGGGPAETVTVMVKDYQVDSVKDTVLHADFIRVGRDQVVDVTVPLEITGKPEGVKLGGALHQVFRLLPIQCQASLIPVKLSADSTPMVIGDSIQVKDLALPEGVVIRMPPTQTLALVIVPKRVQEVTEAAPAEGEAAAAEGEKAEGGEEKEGEEGQGKDAKADAKALARAEKKGAKE